MAFKKENVIWHQNENSQMSLTDSLTVFEVGGKLFLTTFFLLLCIQGTKISQKLRQRKLKRVN